MAWTPNFENLQAPVELGANFGLDESSGDYQSYLNSQSNMVRRMQNQRDIAEYKRVKSDVDASDSAAELESADSMAAANRETSNRTGALAMQLASARRTPGGGIRRGINRRGFNANMAGYGLTKANATERLGKAKKAGRDRIASRYAQQRDAPSQISGITLGPVIGQQFY